MSFPNPAACGHPASAGPELPGGGRPRPRTPPAAPSLPWLLPRPRGCGQSSASACLWGGAAGAPVQGPSPPTVGERGPRPIPASLGSAGRSSANPGATAHVPRPPRGRVKLGECGEERGARAGPRGLGSATGAPATPRGNRTPAQRSGHFVWKGGSQEWSVMGVGINGRATGLLA